VERGPANEPQPLHPPATEPEIPRRMSVTVPSLVDDPAGSEAGNEPENYPRGQRHPDLQRVEPSQGAASSSRPACSILAESRWIRCGGEHRASRNQRAALGADELPPLGRATVDAWRARDRFTTARTLAQSLTTLISLWTLFTWAVERAMDTAFSAACRVLALPLNHTTPFLSVST
jgi:hypothetical protein